MSTHTELIKFYDVNRGFFDSYRVSSAGALRFLETLSADPASAFYSTFFDASGKCVSGDDYEAVSALEVRRVHFVLTSKQRSVLQQVWGDCFSLEFTQSLKVGHPMGAAFRILETEVCLSLCDHSGPIVDVGGNFAYHVRHTRKHVHSCCPAVTLRDKARSSARIEELKVLSRQVGRAGDFARRVLATNSLAFCNQKAEACAIQAKTLLWIHSVYDMKVGDLAMQMEAHGAVVGYGAFMYTDAVFDDEKGRLFDIDGRFERVDSKIQFTFDNDPSFAYLHDWLDYKEFLVDRVINGDKYSYYYRVFPTRRNSMIFCVTRLDSSVVKSPGIRTHLVVRSRRPAIELTVYDVDWSRSFTDVKFVQASVVMVPPDFYHQALSFCFSRMSDEADAEALDLTKFMRQCRTYNRYVDSHGRPLFTDEKVPAYLFLKVVVSLFHLAAMITAFRRIRTGLVIKDIQHRRSLATSSFLSNLFRYCRTFLPMMSSFSRLVDDFRSVLLKKVNSDLLVVIAAEESKFRKLQTMSTVATVTATAEEKTFVNEGVGLDEWEPETSDLALLADVLAAEGSFEEAKFLAGKVGSSDVQSDALQSDTVVGTSVSSDLESEDGDLVTPEYRAKVCELDYDPGDRTEADLYRRAAIDEYVEYCRRTFDKDLGSAKSQMRESWYLDCPSKSYCVRKLNTVESPNYLYFTRGTYTKSLVPLVNESYMWGLNPTTSSLVRIVGGTSSDKGGSMTAKHNGWLFVCSELVVLNSHLVADAVERHLNANGYGQLPEVFLSAGVAGSGKSTRIREAHRPGDMILTATKKCSVDMVSKLSAGPQRSGFSYSAKELSISVKTLDSYLIHSNTTAAVLRVDEAVLVHSGALFAAAMKAGCRVIYLSGDKVQIHFINRIEALMNLQYSKIKFFDHYELWRVSYRLTQDVMKAANTYYYAGQGRTCNTVEVGVEFVKIADTSDPLISLYGNKADLVMGFYKSEKADLAKRIQHRSVGTVHESQGEDYDHTVLARFNDKDVGGLYSGPDEGGEGHPLVGYTRHKRNLVVLHKGPDDFLCEFYRASQEPMNKSDYVFDEALHSRVITYF